VCWEGGLKVAGETPRKILDECDRKLEEIKAETRGQAEPTKDKETVDRTRTGLKRVCDEIKTVERALESHGGIQRGFFGGAVALGLYALLGEQAPVPVAGLEAL